MQMLTQKDCKHGTFCLTPSYSSCLGALFNTILICYSANLLVHVYSQVYNALIAYYIIKLPFSLINASLSEVDLYQLVKKVV